jgi:hypothetical protein
MEATMGDPDTRNEGEGSRTAAKEYNERTKEFTQREDVEGKAKEAKKALEGGEAKDLHDADKAGREHAADEDPQVKRDR